MCGSCAHNDNCADPDEAFALRLRIEPPEGDGPLRGGSVDGRLIPSFGAK